jgi:hypothetical protein
MMSDEQDKDSYSETTNAATNDQAEKRRAALHHAPPQLLMNNNNNNAEQMGTSPGVVRKSLTSAGEYGYAYNNHIPWQQIRPSSNAATTNSRMSHTMDHQEQQQQRTASPSPLLFQVGTPPTGQFLGSTTATPPTGAGFLGGVTPPPMVHPSGLIPPRSSAVTPPFVRPMGFVGEPAPSQPVLPLLPAAAESSHTAASHATPSHQQHGARPVTSLDLLHSSPFQQQHPGASLLSSLGGVQDHNIINTNNSHSVLSGDLRMQAEAALHSYDDHYYPHYEDDDDMPFAVDDSPPPPAGGAADSRSGAGSSSSHLAASSAAVTSFAHRCATANRLALFDSVQQQQQQKAEQPKVDMVSSLADQLAEFKTFGASLMEKASESAGDVSTSTPISLRI